MKKTNEVIKGWKLEKSRPGNFVFNIQIDKKDFDEMVSEIERMQLERDAAVEGFRGQFELAEEAIKENTELREKLKQKDEQIMKIIQAKEVIINTPPLPESEMIKILHEQIIQLQKEIHNMKNQHLTYKRHEDSWYK